LVVGQAFLPICSEHGILVVFEIKR